MMDIKGVLLQRFISFGKKCSGNGLKIENILNKELAEELHKRSIRIFNKRKAKSQLIFCR